MLCANILFILENMTIMDIDRQVYLAKINKLLLAYKELQECQGIDGNYSLLDSMEKMSELFTVLSRDWDSGIKEIYNVLEFYVLHSTVHKRELGETLSMINNHVLSIMALCCHKNYIEQQQIFLEQLFTELKDINPETFNSPE